MLKQMGLSLEQIKDMLAQKNFSPLEVVQKHLSLIQDQATKLQESTERLDGLSRLLQSKGDVSAEQFLEVIRAMHAIDRQFTPDEMELIKEQGHAIGKEGILAAEEEWPRLIAEMTAHMEKGTDPKDPAVQTLGKRWKELVEAFTGGNPQIAQKLKTMYQENPDAAKAFGGPNPELFGYVQKVMEGMNNER